VDSGQEAPGMTERKKISHFTDLEVWQKGHALFLELADDVEEFPAKRVADILSDQLLRSCGSIIANIAEGFNRSTKKFLSCLDIALGETNETENWLYKVRDNRLLPQDLANSRIERCREIGRMLNGLIRSLESRNAA
jgi:four helix bundle protein